MNDENIEKILSELGSQEIPSDVSKLAEQTFKDFDKALAQARKTKHHYLWEYIRKGWATKLTVAAAIFIAFGIGFSTGRWSKPARLATHTLDVTGYTSTTPVYPTAPKAEDSFWRRKTLAAMQPKPYVQNQFTKTNLINAYKKYLKEKDYE